MMTRELDMKHICKKGGGAIRVWAGALRSGRGGWLEAQSFSEEGIQM